MNASMQHGTQRHIGDLTRIARERAANWWAGARWDVGSRIQRAGRRVERVGHRVAASEEKHAFYEEFEGMLETERVLTFTSSLGFDRDEMARLFNIPTEGAR